MAFGARCEAGVAAVCYCEALLWHHVETWQAWPGDGGERCNRLFGVDSCPRMMNECRDIDVSISLYYTYIYNLHSSVQFISAFVKLESRFIATKRPVAIVSWQGGGLDPGGEVLGLWGSGEPGGASKRASRGYTVYDI